MITRPALWPLLWRPRILLFSVVLVLPIVLLAAAGERIMTLYDLRQMAIDPEGRAIARRLTMLVAPFSTMLGAFVGYAVFQAQRMHPGWLLPAMRDQIQRQWLALALVIPGLWIWWVALWAPLADALSGGLFGVVAFGLGGSLAHFGVHVSLRRAGSVVLLGMAAVTIYASSWLVMVADALGVPGLAMAAGLSLVAMWWYATPASHRRLMAWTASAESSADDATAPVGVPAAPPHGTLSWLARLLEERASSATQRWTIPTSWATVANAALIASVLHATNGNAAMLGLAALSDGGMVGRTLTYPLSRLERGTLQWAMQALEVIVLGLVAGSIMFALDRLGVPPLAMFGTREPGEIPSVVLGAAVLALMPFGQAGRVWLPVGTATDWQPTTRVVLFVVPVLPYIMLVIAMARLLWRVSAPSTGQAVAWCALLGVIVQTANLAYCRWVMARRDLVARAG